MGDEKRRKANADRRRANAVAKRKRRRPVQLELPRTGGRGGARRGAGRKPKVPEKRSRVPHVKRPKHDNRHPVHVTLRARAGLPSFRQQLVHRLAAEVLRDQRRRRYKDTFRVLHFSIQSNHVHLVVEANSDLADVEGYVPLRAGVSGFEIAFARRLNRLLGRNGNVWADRYHRHDLKTPKETWNGLAYVFGNYTHHGQRSYGDGVVDVYSSACMFDGWDRECFVPMSSDRWLWPVCPPQTWLASVGYLKHGRLPLAPTN